MDNRTLGNVFQLHSIARFEMTFFRESQSIANLQILRGKYIPFLTISKMESGNSGSSIWVIFKSRHPNRNIKFILEKINISIEPFCTPTSVVASNSTLIIASKGSMQ